jgi:hypothetical protein
MTGVTGGETSEMLWQVSGTGLCSIGKMDTWDEEVGAWVSRLSCVA